MNKVSVIIPTHNRKEYLRAAIESVLAQTYKNIEIIVVDDGSTDGTIEVANAYSNKIRYFLQENLGASVARNFGVSKAAGNFIAFLDDDDLFLEHKLEKQLAIINDQPEIALVASQAYLVDKDGQIDYNSLVFDRNSTGIVPFEEIIITPHTSIAPSSCLFRRSIFDEIGLFDPAIRFGEDWDLIIRSARNHKIYYINQPLLCMRVHQQNRMTDYVLDNQKAFLAFQDHLRVIEKSLPLLRKNENLLKQKALSMIYGEMAINYIANGNDEEGKVHFEKARNFNADTWNWNQDFNKNIVNYSRALLKEKSLEDAMLFIEKIIDIFMQPPTENTIRQTRKHQGLLLADAVFWSSERGEYSGILRNTIKALWYDPELLRNRGLFSVCLASLFNFHSLGEMKRQLFHHTKGN